MSYFGGSSGMVGDPGFFGSLFGFGKRLIGGLASRSPVGQVVQATQQAFKPPRAALIPEVATGFGVGAGTVVAQRALSGGCPPNGGCPSGHHMNRSSYHLMDGTFVPEGSRCVKNRTRNPYNKRAATRAAGRLKSLGKGIKTIKKSVNLAATALK